MNVLMKLECLFLGSFSSMSVSKAMNLPKSGALERCFNKVGSGLKKIVSDKDSSLLRTFQNYACKKFFNIGPSFPTWST